MARSFPERCNLERPYNALWALAHNSESVPDCIANEICFDWRASISCLQTIPLTCAFSLRFHRRSFESSLQHVHAESKCSSRMEASSAVTTSWYRYLSGNSIKFDCETRNNGVHIRYQRFARLKVIIAGFKSLPHSNHRIIRCAMLINTFHFQGKFYLNLLDITYRDLKH